MDEDTFWDRITDLEKSLELQLQLLDGGCINPPAKLCPIHLGLGHPNIDPKYEKSVQAGRYRFLARDSTVKYLIYAFPDSDREEYVGIKWPFGFTELPNEPGVDWNIGYLTKPSREADYFVIRSTEMRNLPGIPCPLTDIPRVEYPHQFHTNVLDRTHLQSHGFHEPQRVAGVKFPFADIKYIAEFDKNKALLATDLEWHDFGRKNHSRLWTSATVHAAVHGHDITPRLLAYITEDRYGRVIGMAVELLDDARVAGIEDIEECRAVLVKLHSLGILYGESLDRLSFLVVEEEGGGNNGGKRKRALMQGFTRSEFSGDGGQQRMELDRVSEVLREEVELQRPKWMGKGTEVSRDDLPDLEDYTMYSPVSPYRYKPDEKL